MRVGGKTMAVAHIGQERLSPDDLMNALEEIRSDYTGGNPAAALELRGGRRLEGGDRSPRKGRRAAGGVRPQRLVVLHAPHRALAGPARQRARRRRRETLARGQGGAAARSRRDSRAL